MQETISVFQVEKPGADLLRTGGGAAGEELSA
jgi:hypothetical protein